MITESWLYETGDEAYITSLTPQGYKCFSFPRKGGSRGGGIAVIIKCNLTNIINLTEHCLTTFHAIELKLRFDKKNISCICIYRPPPSKKNKLKTSVFIDEFIDFLANFALNLRDVFFVGDFNLHYDNKTHWAVKRLNDIFNDNDLTQLINQATQRSGHILDWLIVFNGNDLLTLIDIIECQGISDHKAIAFSLSLSKPKLPLKTIISRKMKSINLDNFRSDLKSQLDEIDLNRSCVNDLVSTYNDCLKALLDIHAPLVKRTIRDRPSAYWRTEDVIEAKRKVRRAERENTERPDLQYMKTSSRRSN